MKRRLVVLGLIAVAAGSLAIVIRPFLKTSDLFVLVQRGDCHKLRECLNSGANPNVRNELGMTPLHYAAHYRNRECMEALIASGADVNATDALGSTPLHSAVISQTRIGEHSFSTNPDDDAAVVELLLDSGAFIDSANSQGETALSLASSHFLRHCANTLLSRGATVDVKDVQGRTALFNAVEIRDKGMVTVLLAHGADPTIEVRGRLISEWAADAGFENLSRDINNKP